MKFMDMQSGNPFPLGSHYDGEGVNFALFSANAERVELCLFDSDGKQQIASVDLPEHTHEVWHGYIPGIKPGAVYGYRVHGAYDPMAGHRFNANKLLIDPYARQLRGDFRWSDSHFAYQLGNKQEDLSFDTSDNAADVPKCVVAPAASDMPVQRIQTNPAECLIYELHTRGFTLKHPEIPSDERGTFAGLAHPLSIEYLQSLGVSSVELLPVHAYIDEHFLVERGLKNYWGYNTLNFFTPHAAYLGGSDASAFRSMVDRFHDANIEVILDVVYNHTCESNHLGPTLSFRGIDNAAYYRLQSESARFYVNDTGCGNTLNIDHPRVLQMVMDSLRYWAIEMGVDGFRFDLAATLGREPHGFNRGATFLQTIAQDPQLSRLKLIAEPWDIGPGGYQLGNFPSPWGEWNDAYRDTVRKFWRNSPGILPTFARRLHGSSDIFERSGRNPYASVNFITSHDGFTLRDLVSYNDRHNQANGEKNRDGHHHNLSMNFGVEGETDVEEINALRQRQQRNYLATLFVSQGTPMLLAGDELGKTQGGNNNAYCQDNEINWLDWTRVDENLQRFVKLMSALRRRYPVLAHGKYIHASSKEQAASIAWLNADGSEMREEHWQEHQRFTLGYLLSAQNASAEDYRILVLFNNASEAVDFSLPSPAHGAWQCLMDTHYSDGLPNAFEFDAQSDSSKLSSIDVTLEPRCIAIFLDAGFKH